MADPSALARGRIQMLEEQSLPVGDPPGSSCRYHGASRLQSPSKVAGQSPGQPLLPAVGKSYIQALSCTSTAELQGRTKALGGGTDLTMVKERFLGCMEVLWAGEDTGESLKQGQDATVLRWWALHESLLVG